MSTNWPVITCAGTSTIWSFSLLAYTINQYRFNRWQPKLSLHLLVLVPWYHFRARLWLQSARLLQRYQFSSRLPSNQAIYGRSFSARPLRFQTWVWPMLSAILIVTFFICHCWSTTTKKGANVRDVWDVCTRYTRCMYKIFLLIPSTHDSLVARKRFRSTYDRVNSSALQTTTSCGAHRRVFSSLHNGCSLFAW